MSSIMYELKPLNNIPGSNIVLPEQNVRRYLINNNHIKSIKEPSNYINGIIIDLKVSNDGLLVLLNTVEAFQSIKKSFKSESIDWYVLNWNFEEWVAILILLFFGKQSGHPQGASLNIKIK